MNTRFWHGRHVFITGHTGFKGSWLSLWLHAMGARLSGYALQPPTLPSLYETAKVGACVNSITADIRDLRSLTRAMQGASPEVVIHMAAQPLVRYAYINPVETYATNVMGTVNLFEAVRATPSVRAVINVTSDKCYENFGWTRGYREDDPMGGYDPYSSSKGCAELVSAAYRSSYFNGKDIENQDVAVATVRAGNVVGGGDWGSERLVPSVIQAFERDEPVAIRYPNAVRPWQHVLEPLRGYLLLAERLVEDGPAFEGGWNFGPHEEDAKSVEWVVENLATRWGGSAQWRRDQKSQPHEAERLMLDISKARCRLNWFPVLRLTDALDMVVGWYRARQAGMDICSYTLTQIETYQNRVRSVSLPNNQLGEAPT